MSDWNDVEDGDEGTVEGENKSFKDLRNHARKLEREAKAREAELEELRTFKTEIVTERRDAALGATFAEVGLPSATAKLFAKVNPEIEPEAITADVVRQFATDYGLAAAEAAAAATEAAPKQEEGFTPVQVGAPAGLKTYTVQEIQDLMRAGDYDAVNKAVKEGRVQKEQVPWTR